MGLGTNLKKILKDKGKTLKWLAAETDISINTLYSITKRDSTRVSIDNVNKIANALGITASQLMGEPVIQTEEELEMLLSVINQKTELTSMEKVNKLMIQDIYGSEDAEKYELLINSMRHRERISNHLKELTLPYGSDKEIVPDKLSELLNAFYLLNDLGKIEAIMRIQEMTKLEKYTK